MSQVLDLPTLEQPTDGPSFARWRSELGVTAAAVAGELTKHPSAVSVYERGLAPGGGLRPEEVEHAKNFVREQVKQRAIKAGFIVLEPQDEE